MKIHLTDYRINASLLRTLCGETVKVAEVASPRQAVTCEACKETDNYYERAQATWDVIDNIKGAR